MHAWFYWMWVGLVALLILFFTPVFGELASRMSRCLGRPPRLWDDDARVLSAEFDGDGLVQALVYDAEETLFNPSGRRAKRWVRRWERGRGIAWEQRAALAQREVVTAAGEIVVFPTITGTLRAVDARTGETRWEVPLALERLEPTRTVDSMLLIGGTHRETKRDAWLEIDTRDGAVRAEGKGDLGEVEKRLRGEPRGPDPEPRDIEGWRRYFGDDARLRREWADPETSEPSWQIDNRTELVKEPRPNDERFSHDLVLRCCAAAGEWSYTLGPAGADAELIAARPIGDHYIVDVIEVWRAPDGTQRVTLILDMAQRRVVADICQSRAQFVEPGGALRALAL